MDVSHLDNELYIIGIVVPLAVLILVAIVIAVCLRLRCTAWRKNKSGQWVEDKTPAFYLAGNNGYDNLAYGNATEDETKLRTLKSGPPPGGPQPPTAV